MCADVEQATKEVKGIREAIDELARIKDASVLAAIGLPFSDSEISSDDSDSGDELSCQEVYQEIQQDIDLSKLTTLAKSSDFNCFHIMSELEESGEGLEIVTQLYKEISKLDLSYAAFQYDVQNSEIKARSVRAINGEIVTESESDDPSDYIHLQSAHTPTGLKLVKKKRRAIRRRTQRLKVNAVVEHGVLSRRHSHSF